MSSLSEWIDRIKQFPGPGWLRTKRLTPPAEGGTLIVTHAELSARHGTGALLIRILRGEKKLVAFYSREFFKTHDIEVAAFPITHARDSLGAGRRRIRQLLNTNPIKRILCVPFYQDDVHSALAAQAYTGAPLALYIMDDQNIHVKEIPDSLMRQLIGKASICFAISSALCSAYAAKYRRKFWFVPPVADPELFVPPGFTFEPHSPPRGILIGNLWSSHTLNQFHETVRQAGFQIDWFGNAGQPFIELDSAALAKDGISLHSHVPEPALIASARNADFAVIPAGTLDGSDTHDWLARASLPSRIIYLMATANVPMIVMGHPETAAAKFVAGMKLGAVCDYSGESFRAAVKQVTDPATMNGIRLRARTLSPTFSSQGLSNWLWDSLAQSKVVDERFESISLTT
jgi:hypothetical protein